MTESKDHDVGYGKPPVNHQFQKGQSGNPGGRPRGSKSFKTILEEELGHTIPSTRKGDGGKISVKRALVRKAIQTGLTTGDLRPLEKFGALNEDDQPSNYAFTLCFDNERQYTTLNGEIIHDYRLDRSHDIDDSDVKPA